jgi:hypothetical protein
MYFDELATLCDVNRRRAHRQRVVGAKSCTALPPRRFELFRWRNAEAQAGWPSAIRAWGVHPRGESFGGQSGL